MPASSGCPAFSLRAAGSDHSGCGPGAPLGLPQPGGSHSPQPGGSHNPGGIQKLGGPTAHSLGVPQSGGLPKPRGPTVHSLGDQQPRGAPTAQGLPQPRVAPKARESHSSKPGGSHSPGGAPKAQGSHSPGASTVWGAPTAHSPGGLPEPGAWPWPVTEAEPGSEIVLAASQRVEPLSPASLACETGPAALTGLQGALNGALQGGLPCPRRRQRPLQGHQVPVCQPSCGPSV